MPLQVRHRPGEPQGPLDAAIAQPALQDLRVEQMGGLRQRQMVAQIGPWDRPVGGPSGPGQPSLLPVAGKGDPSGDHRRGLGRREPGPQSEVRGRRRLHHHRDVDPVTQRAGDPAAIAMDDAGRTRAVLPRHPEVPARARVRRHHELKACRIAHLAMCPGQGDLAGLQRCPQRIQHHGPEFGGLVQEQDPAVRP
ncbi:hypothetical protein SDC9_125752 [bioreactor metagenome]|uniref:Uncharacterized protein n=1 Tax=bioreactor metagenome TaxID=1076179 RepID=A0A645CP93_9ZZZZ